MKQRICSCALSLILCLGGAVPALAAPSAFSDVPQTHWAYASVQYMVEQGLFQGTGAGTFSPDATMSRAMLLQVLYQWAGAPAVSGTVTSKTPIQDVPADAYYADALVWAWENSLLPPWFTASLSGGAIEPNRTMSRLDLAVMLSAFREQVLGQPLDASFYASLGFTAQTCPLMDMREEALSASLSAAYPQYIPQMQDVTTGYEALAWAYHLGIMSGTTPTTMSPMDGVTRAQAAAILTQFSRIYGEETPSNQPAQSDAVAQVVELVNQARAEQGLVPMEATDELNQAAQVRAEEISTLFDHTRPDGRSCFSVLEDAGISYWTTGENIAAGYNTPQRVVEGWLNSPGHRANILNPNFTHIGVGLFYDPSTGRDYWVQLFTN